MRVAGFGLRRGVAGCELRISGCKRVGIRVAGFGLKRGLGVGVRVAGFGLRRGVASCGFWVGESTSPLQIRDASSSARLGTPTTLPPAQQRLRWTHEADIEADMYTIGLNKA